MTTSISLSRILSHRVASKTLISFFILSIIVSCSELKIGNTLGIEKAQDAVHKNYLYLNFHKAKTSQNISVVFVTTEFKPERNNQPIVFYDIQSRLLKKNRYKYSQRGFLKKTFKYESKKVYIYVVELEDLSPQKSYYFTLSFNNSQSKTHPFLGKEHKFKTLSNTSENFSFVTGGDCGTSTEVGILFKHAAGKNPDFVAIGGDIAYANGKLHNIKKWFTWLKYYTENMKTNNGYLIPFFAAIGNHEVAGGYDMRRDKAPFYYNFLHQGTKGYGHYLFGKELLFFFLDSNHTTAEDGSSIKDQANYIKETLIAYRAKRVHKKWKMAIYHVPLFPSNRDYNGMLSTTLRNNWAKVFADSKFICNFENHEHTLKISKPISGPNGTTPTFHQKDGVIYFGDGSFGKDPRRVDPIHYLETSLSKRHFWYVEVKPNAIINKAYNLDNIKVAEKTLLPRN